jgi:hypothetical protein
LFLVLCWSDAAVCVCLHKVGLITQKGDMQSGQAVL